KICLQFSYTLGEENHTTRTTTLRTEFVCETGTLNVERVITPEGLTAVRSTVCPKRFCKVLAILGFGNRRGWISKLEIKSSLAEKCKQLEWANDDFVS